MSVRAKGQLQRAPQAEEEDESNRETEAFRESQRQQENLEKQDESNEETEVARQKLQESQEALENVSRVEEPVKVEPPPQNNLEAVAEDLIDTEKGVVNRVEHCDMECKAVYLLYLLAEGVLVCTAILMIHRSRREAEIGLATMLCSCCCVLCWPWSCLAFCMPLDEKTPAKLVGAPRRSQALPNSEAPATGVPTAGDPEAAPKDSAAVASTPAAQAPTATAPAAPPPAASAAAQGNAVEGR